MGQFDRLINTLTDDPSDRAALRALAAGMDDNPMMAGGRTEALLRELARPAVRPDGVEYTNEEAFAYATDFADAIGIPSGLIAPALSAIGDAEVDIGLIEDQAVVDHIESVMRNDPDGCFGAPEETRREYEAALERLNAPRPAAEPGGPIFDDPAYRLAVRGHDERRRAEIEQIMRTDGGRPYWNSPAMQREYGEILSRQAAPPVMPTGEVPPAAVPATTLAGSAAAPAPAAPEAPPTGQEVA
jgi:hypothetical protein